MATGKALSNAPGNAFFKDKLTRHLVVLPDEDLVFFSAHATAVEPHVRIDDISGTADDYPNVMQSLHGSDPQTYRLSTREAMALLRWLRQFAAAAS